MSTTTHINDKIERVRNDKTLSIPAKRLMEHLQPIPSQVDILSKRWMWELLQNATDCGDNITAEFIIRDDSMEFRHNGNAFTLEEVYNLIMPDSDKDDFETRHEEDLIGQFGTGFLSTHVLSSYIKVNGVFQDEGGHQYYGFEFDLDRSQLNNREALKLSIEKAGQQFKNGIKPKLFFQEGQSSSASFTYFFDKAYPGIDGREVVEGGLDYLEEFLPYVFAFRPQLDKVLITYDTRENKRSYYQERIETELNIEEDFFDFVKVKRAIRYKKRKRYHNERFVGTIKKNNTIIAFPFRANKSRWSVEYEFNSFPKLFPRIFCGFPMFGTESFPFPVMIHSAHFRPKRERDGITLTSNDLKNRVIIEDAVKAFQNLIGITEQHKFRHSYNICGFHYEGSISQKYLQNSEANFVQQKIILPLKKIILNAKIVEMGKEVDEIFKKLEEIFFFDTDKRKADFEETLLKLFDLDYAFYSGNSPRRRDVISWFRNLNYNVFASNVQTLESCLKFYSENIFIEPYEEVEKAILKNKFASLTDWTNSMIELLHEQGRLELLDQYALLPNQAGTFSKRQDLFLDNIYHKKLNEGYEEKLKSIHGLLNREGEIREKLLSNDLDIDEFDLFPNRVFTLKKLASLIDEDLRGYNGGPDDPHFIKIISELFDWTQNCGIKSEETIADLMPWFSQNKANYYLQTQSSKDRSNTFDILLSGKSDALAELARSGLSKDEIRVLSKQAKQVKKILDYLNRSIPDLPYEDLGEAGEQIVFNDLCQKFGENNVECVKKDSHDFEVMDPGGVVKMYVDAKTTGKGMANADNVPFYMRMAQWNFLPGKDNYYIARLFKQEMSIKYLKIQDFTTKLKE